MANDTIFDKVLAGDIPAETVYDDGDILAFKDIDPQAPVHVLVIPKKRASRFIELKDAAADDVGRLFIGIARVAEKLGLEKDGFRVVVNNGTHGQQTVEYLHAHILGGRQLSWPPG